MKEKLKSLRGSEMKAKKTRTEKVWVIFYNGYIKLPKYQTKSVCTLAIFGPGVHNILFKSKLKGRKFINNITCVPIKDNPYCLKQAKITYEVK